MIVDLKSLKHPLWSNRGGNFSQGVCVDTHDSVFPKWSRERYKEAQMEGALHLVVVSENYGMGWDGIKH